MSYIVFFSVCSVLSVVKMNWNLCNKEFSYRLSTRYQCLVYFLGVAGAGVVEVAALPFVS